MSRSAQTGYLSSPTAISSCAFGRDGWRRRGRTRPAFESPPPVVGQRATLAATARSSPRAHPRPPRHTRSDRRPARRSRAASPEQGCAHCVCALPSKYSVSSTQAHHCWTRWGDPSAPVVAIHRYRAERSMRWTEVQVSIPFGARVMYPGGSCGRSRFGVAKPASYRPRVLCTEATCGFTFTHVQHSRRVSCNW